MRNGLALYGQHRATSTGVVQIGCQVEPARIYGIVQNTGVAGDTVSVALNGGISTAHTGLTAGTAYLTKFGYITTTTNSRILGEIISATNISVSPNSDYFNDSIVGSTLAGTSPWTFRNTLGKQLHCYLSGGTVSAVQLNTVNTAWSASHSFML